MLFHSFVLFMTVTVKSHLSDTQTIAEFFPKTSGYVAQEIPQIDAEIAQKGHFRMETN